MTHPRASRHTPSPNYATILQYCSPSLIIPRIESSGYCVKSSITGPHAYFPSVFLSSAPVSRKKPAEQAHHILNRRSTINVRQATACSLSLMLQKASNTYELLERV